MNKKILLAILIIVLIGVVAYLTLSKKRSLPDQQQLNNFQNMQTDKSGNNNAVTLTDMKTLTDIARSYLQKNNQQIYLFVLQKDGTIAVDTGISIPPQEKSIEDLKIDWKWFINHNPDYISDAGQPPQLSGIPNYRPNNGYVVQWEYNKYTITVKIDKNFNAQSTEISPRI